MKGIIIYGNPIWGDNERATYCELINEASFDLRIISKDQIVSRLEGESSEKSKASCSSDDTYDFETGALIALMKMCGVDKVVRACNEAFSEDTFKTYATKYERELNELKKDFDKLGDRNKYLIDDINKKLEYIKEKDEEIEKLKSDKDKSWKNYQRNIQKKQDRINELNNIEEGYIKLREEYDSLFEEKEKLQHEYNLCLNSENALKYTVDSLNKSVDKLNKAIVGYKNDLYNTAKRCKELEEENEKLKLDCEKLQHGYNDTYTLFCGGRQNGKQYTFLVDLFKKLDQKKVDAAYKEAYGSRLIWCTSQSSIRDFLDKHIEQINKLTVDSLIEENRAFTRKCVNEWLYKIPTKREEMWENILGASKCPPVDIKVSIQDIKVFLKELQDKIPEARWNGSDCLLTEYTNPYWFKHDCIYFALFRYDDKGNLKLCYSENKHSWIDKPVIDYLPPMRWDLFEKGRLVVKVSKENYAEFCSRVFSHFDKVGVNAFNHDCKFGYFMFNKDTDYVERILASDCGDTKEINRHKVVDWEDVR